MFAPRPAPREVGSVAQTGGPYGVIYDAMRDRLWVASSGTNEVVGYDMAEAIPRQVVRFKTVQNPYTLGVDTATGWLFIAGITGAPSSLPDRRHFASPWRRSGAV